jgi:hypothetical protein
MAISNIFLESSKTLEILNTPEYASDNQGRSWLILPLGHLRRAADLW